MEQYAGNEDNFPVSVGVVDSGDDWDADNLGVASEGALDRTAYLAARARRASLDWRPGLTGWTNTTYVPFPMRGGDQTAFDGIDAPPIWDSFAGRWLCSFNANGAGTGTTAPIGIWESYDGLNWSGIWEIIQLDVSGDLVAQGLVVRGTDGAMLYIVPTYEITTGPTYFAALLVSNPGAGGTGITGTLTNPSAGCWYSGAWFDSQFVVWQGGSTDQPWYVAGTAFVVATTWPAPAGFTIHNLAHVEADGRILLFPSGATGTASTSAYMQSTDGKNWSTIAMPALLAGESVVDATYDSLRELFLLLVCAGTSSRLLSSASAAAGSWAVVQTIPFASSALRASAMGDFVMLVQTSEQPSLSTTLTRAIMSTNGGVSWYSTPLVVPSPASLASLHSSGSQFLYADVTDFAASATVGRTVQIV